MTQSIGYWCDECRVKYVQHVCKDDRLPCGHPFGEAVRVYVKGYGRGGSEFTLESNENKVHGWLNDRVQTGEERVLYLNWRARELRGTVVTHSNGQDVLIDWLHRQPAKLIRAFENRWDSWKQPPEWRVIETLNSHPETLSASESNANVVPADKRDVVIAALRECPRTNKDGVAALIVTTQLRDALLALEGKEPPSLDEMLDEIELPDEVEYEHE